MRTIKLVVIGASGVGKTSLRGQYISGRFSTGYRATIGADFITKSLPDPKTPTEVISLQIWDTAGQERFSSLSSAFFRGADAVLLMFDVSAPETMHALTKWWEEFKHRAPVSDEEVDNFCCVVVGNKMDLLQPGMGVTVEEAQRFVQELVPLSEPEPQVAEHHVEGEIVVDPISGEDEDVILEHQLGLGSHTDPASLLAPSARIDIQNHHKLSKSRSRSSTLHTSTSLYGTFRSGVTSFHTPSSSLSEIYTSARSSPLPGSQPGSPARMRRMTSLSSTSTTTTTTTTTTTSSSALTITPSLFTRGQRPTTPQADPDLFLPSALPDPPDTGPKLFLTSAKTGTGVSDAFEYIALRVVRKWEYEEAVEARTFHVRDESDGDTVRLGLEDGRRKWKTPGSCCGQ
ncbi:P-loop containing nucleoside triphosphate hydrolase protein [Suillus subaureus]|uniref:P-loop containing nucleoside triphosphate hydrolase protein n=1 Tax=Suillus subaureus TaxID=48587 RepID=A0A9P7ECQ0_9AGAM|nr:P-loop containing nucleoside triphosphate hydrolase protein [Suillus subaureus]KAG1817298.1 P-loop containing nucleoside triphosphate hydrolase protein [Suillus subaureus]